MKQPSAASQPGSQQAPGGRPGTRAHAQRGGAGGSDSVLPSLPNRAKRKRGVLKSGKAARAPPAGVAESEPDDGHVDAGVASAHAVAAATAAEPAAAGGCKPSHSIDLLPQEVQHEEQKESGEQQQQQQQRQPALPTPHLDAAGPADMSPEQGQGLVNAAEAEEVSLQEQQQQGQVQEQQQDSQSSGQGGKGTPAMEAEQELVEVRGPKRLKLCSVSDPGCT